MGDQLLNAKQLAERLGVAALTVYRMAEQGRIPSVPIGRMIRFDFEAVRKHLADSQTGKRGKLCPRERGAERRPEVAKTQHFSRGYVRLRKDVANPYYEGQYRIYRSGQEPERKSINLGYESEIKVKEARLRLQELPRQATKESSARPSIGHAERLSSRLLPAIISPETQTFNPQELRPAHRQAH